MMPQRRMNGPDSRAYLHQVAVGHSGHETPLHVLLEAFYGFGLQVDLQFHVSVNVEGAIHSEQRLPGPPAGPIGKARPPQDRQRIGSRRDIADSKLPLCIRLPLEPSR